jgi:hypothetical protein
MYWNYIGVGIQGEVVKAGPHIEKCKRSGLIKGALSKLP